MKPLPVVIAGSCALALAAVALADNPDAHPQDAPLAAFAVEDAEDETVLVITKVTCCVDGVCTADTRVDDCNAPAGDAALAEPAIADVLKAADPRTFRHTDPRVLVPVRVLGCNKTEHIAREEPGESGPFATGAYAFCEVAVGELCAKEPATLLVAWRLLPFGADGLGSPSLRQRLEGRTYGVIFGAEGRSLKDAVLVDHAEDQEDPCAR